MKRLRTGAVVAAVLLVPAIAQGDDEQAEDNTRSVRIIDAPVTAPAPEPAPPAGAPPAAQDPVSPPQPGASIDPPKPVDLGALGANIKAANPAEVSIDILPGPEIAIGSRVSFRVSAKKPGYLILVDVDPAGKLTQIYPNPTSLMTSAGRPTANHVRPGKPVQIPSPAEARTFEFVASAPLGTAMVVAILSDRPVQMVDLPDIPAAMIGQASALSFLTKLAGDLRIPQGDDGGRLQEVRWSFDAKLYAVR